MQGCKGGDGNEKRSRRRRDSPECELDDDGLRGAQGWCVDCLVALGQRGMGQKDEQREGVI